MHREMDIDSVEKLLEETEEAREYQRVRLFLPHLNKMLIILKEIGEMLAANLTLDEEEAVQVELVELQAVSLIHILDEQFFDFLLNTRPKCHIQKQRSSFRHRPPQSPLLRYQRVNSRFIPHILSHLSVDERSEPEREPNRVLVAA
jgi:hypothetical protein